jgi:hypothetical protein
MKTNCIGSKNKPGLFWIACCLAMLLPWSGAQAQSLVRHTPSNDEGTYRLIVKLKDGYKSEFNQSLSSERVTALSVRCRATPTWSPWRRSCTALI